MSASTIQPRIFYGLKNGIIGSASYISENEILYPAGGVLIVHNYTQKLQRYIKLEEKDKHVNIICVSPSRKVAAVAERGGKPSISIYDLTTLKKKNILRQLTETAAQEYVSLSFSFDGKFLAAIVGDPDWTLIYFQWEKGKIDSMTKARNPTTSGHVTQVACNPTDSSVLVIVGLQLFRLLCATEKTWRQYGWSKADSLNITSVAWLTFDSVIAGTSNGNLLLVENGELKAIYRAMDLTDINMKLHTDFLMFTRAVSVSALRLVVSRDHVPHPELAVRALINFTKGFAFACGSGMVHLFERETSSKYSKRNVFLIPEPEFQEPGKEDLNTVQALSISPQEDQLLATAMWSQMFSVKLWVSSRPTFVMLQAQEIPFKIVGEQLHYGPITGLSVCAWKPLFMTCGQLDRTVSVWNYETGMQELMKRYQDEIFSAAIHPTGLYALIGFSDKLRFMVMTLDDMRPCREFSIRGCRECCFSNDGHLFAAVNGNTIQVYSSVSFENMHNLKGHNGMIRALVWTQQDMKLVSCGTEGALYEWDMSSGTRIGEIITKGCIFSSAAATTDGKTSFGTGIDGSLMEVTGSTITQTINLTGQQLDCIVLSRSNQMMFLAAHNGSVLSVKYPLQEPVQYTDHNMHSHPITRMCMSCDGLTLITCSMDGTICIWKVAPTKGRTVEMDREFQPSTDVLISKADLLDKIQLIKDLSVRMHELESEQAYKAQKSDSLHAQEVKELQEGYCQAIKELKEKNEQLESDHTAELNSSNENMSKMKEAHEQAIMALEANFNEKLIVEYNKYQTLEAHTNKISEDYERKLQELSRQRKDELSSTTEQYKTQLAQCNLLIAELHNEVDRRIRENEATTQHIEDDADHEIVELKTGYEKLLHEERETNLRLRGETGVMRKKFVSAQREIEEFRLHVYTLQQEQQRLEQTTARLQHDVSELKREMKERDSTIQDKEKQIYDLKRKNQEMEKFKFVLNYKITELKNQTEPKDQEIRARREQIQEMDAELENLQRLNTSLELQLAEVRGKLKATGKELMSERERNQEARTLFRHIRFDLHNASGLIQEPKELKDTVKHLHHKYGQDTGFIRSQGQDVKAQMEFMRQREHLEHTVASLKRQVYKSTSAKRDNVSKIMHENTTLIIELNDLRKELKAAHKKISDMESILGTSSRYTNPKEAQARLQRAVQSHEDIHTKIKVSLFDDWKEAHITRLGRIRSLCQLVFTTRNLWTD
ncbi:Cilia- and flagella-associated protein 57 [Cryptotermes secundus]|uniref:Cilia-and flagella-associated protein 57 n=1 Tax=Cryptotermes secundus TaxID=105785 RepID=A0A2J7R3M8_9NEOP|nr:Cilia- and flagella-associated protein 57 [Cryptotermes secundus]